jgi:hypothetical protein
MISPLGQRQIFQAANVEAVKQAQEVSEQIQRENAKKRVADERLLEDEASVRVISNAESIRTDERQGRGGQGSAEEELPSGTPKPKQEEENPAESADSHLDFLA